MRVLMILNLILILANSCNDGNAIQKETQKRIVSHKTFVEELSFEGVIIDKSYCSNCNFNKFQIKIGFDNAIKEKIALNNLSFPPYYSFSGNKEIVLSVNKELFDKSQKGLRVRKEAGSDNLFVTDASYKLLSAETYEWIP